MRELTCDENQKDNEAELEEGVQGEYGAAGDVRIRFIRCVHAKKVRLAESRDGCAAVPLGDAGDAQQEQAKCCPEQRDCSQVMPQSGADHQFGKSAFFRIRQRLNFPPCRHLRRIVLVNQDN